MLEQSSIGHWSNQMTVAHSVFRGGRQKQMEFIPKGWQTVAGGRSAAQTTGRAMKDDRIPKGCQKDRRFDTGCSQVSGIPSGCVPLVQSSGGLRCDPVVYTQLDHSFGPKASQAVAKSVILRRPIQSGCGPGGVSVVRLL